MENLNREELKDIVRGACFLASGGGGAFETGMQIADCFEPSYYGCSEIKMLTVNEAKAMTTAKYGVVTAVMGAPERMKEIKNAGINEVAVKKLAELCGIDVKEIGCIVPAEIGALSSVIACVTAAKMGIPVLDGDGAGRAVPVLNMTSFAIKGVSVNPTVLVGSNGNHVAIDISGAAQYTASSAIESLARPILDMPEFGGMAALAIWLIDLQKIDEIITIRDTLTKCKTVGKTIRETLEMAMEAGEEPSIENLLPVLQSVDYKPGFVYYGTLREATTNTSGGFDHGRIEIEVDAERHLKIIFQNESLLLWDTEKSAPVAVAPDLISYVIVPREKPVGQWIYTNGDLIGPDGKLLEKLKDADIVVVGMCAPKELQDSALEMETLQSFANGLEAYFKDSYRSMLEKLNYYGKYEPLKPGIK